MNDNGDHPGEDRSALTAVWAIEEHLHEIAASQRITRAALQVVIALMLVGIVFACLVWLVGLNWP